jgi:hypothetical protein
MSNHSAQLAAPRYVHPADSRHYLIEKQYPSGQWLKVAFAMSTREADLLIAQKTRFESGRFRATRAA